LQALVWGAINLLTGVLCFHSFPSFQLGFDIAFENFSQIVVAIKLVFVGNTSEGLDGVKNRHV
jgi:hypothetical protein